MTAAADTAIPQILPDALGSAARAFIAGPHRLLIGAERPQAADGRTFATLDPATGREIAQVSHAGAAGCGARGGGGARGVRRRPVGLDAGGRARGFDARAGRRDGSARRGARADRVARQRQAGRARPVRRREWGRRAPALLRGLADEDRGRACCRSRRPTCTATHAANRSGCAGRSSRGTSPC